MNDLFLKIEDFLTAAEAQARDAAEKAAEVADEFAAWLRAQAAKPAVTKASSPTDKQKLADLTTRCHALSAPQAAGPVSANGQWLALLAKVVAAILAALA